VILAIAFIVGSLAGRIEARGEPLRTEQLTIESAGQQSAFEVEIADTPRAQEQGLMFRKEMAPSHGMLFEFDPANPRNIAFWMKNTFIPLDLVFIGQKGEIAGIVKNAEPRTTTPRGIEAPVIAVLEINGGTADRLGIRPGDRVIHPFFQ
jgi:uncharacterized membrane protein (UPF0127 family)